MLACLGKKRAWVACWALPHPPSVSHAGPSNRGGGEAAHTVAVPDNVILEGRVCQGLEDGPDMDSDCLMDVGLPLGVMRISEARQG